MSSKFDQIRPWSVELAALERQKKSFTYMYLRTIQNIFMTFWLAGEQSLPFGLLVYLIFFILADNKDNCKLLDQFTWFSKQGGSRRTGRPTPIIGAAYLFVKKMNKINK